MQHLSVNPTPYLPSLWASVAPFLIFFVSTVSHAELTPTHSTVEAAQAACESAAAELPTTTNNACEFFAIGQTDICYFAFSTATPTTLDFTEGTAIPYGGWHASRRYIGGVNDGELRCFEFEDETAHLLNWFWSDTCENETHVFMSGQGEGFCVEGSGGSSSSSSGGVGLTKQELKEVLVEFHKEDIVGRWAIYLTVLVGLGIPIWLAYVLHRLVSRTVD